MNTSTTSNGQSSMQVLNIPIEDIIPNRFQPRLNFDESSLKELASSIKEHGIIQPLVLRSLGDKYEIIAGERRYKAAKMAGLTQVPAIISTMDDRKSAEVAIVENVQRKDLSSIEEAKSYKALLDKGYLTQEELAKKMGLSQSAIANKLRLLALSNEVQQALIEGKISERHARSLLQVNDLAEQNKWLKIIITERLTVKELDKRLKNGNKDNEDNGENKAKDEIPLIMETPNINIIKEKAMDINGGGNEMPKYEDINAKLDNGSNKTEVIPNKFFNYLEDEAINMNSLEPDEKEDEEEDSEEEIEMLDFLAPEEDIKIGDNEQRKENKQEEQEISLTEKLTDNVVTKIEDSNVIENKVMAEINNSINNDIKDMSKVEKMITELKEKLQLEYQINIVKEENSKELKYIITVSKE